MVNLNIGHRYDENCTEKSRKSQNKFAQMYDKDHEKMIRVQLLTFQAEVP